MCSLTDIENQDQLKDKMQYSSFYFCVKTLL